MKINLYIITLLIVTICSCTEQPKKPNVLFILADDYGYKDLSCMGSSFYETPNIDKIADGGVIFTNGYAACRVCSPSRASIMTGQFTARHGITDWIGAKSGVAWRKKKRSSKLLPSAYKHELSPDCLTLPEAMKEEGYMTFFAGKWHLGKEGCYPEDNGFDINKGGWRVGSPKGGYFSPYNNPKLNDGHNGENLSMRLARETSEFIKANKDTTFFAYLSFYAVHGPIQTSQEKWEKYRNKAEEQGFDHDGFEMERRLPIRKRQDNPIYAGLVETMDAAVGEVLKTLEELGLDENTIIIFTSDNGGVASGDNYSTSNAPLRGGKGYQWEGGIREPFFIKIPWLSTGKISNTPVSSVDLYPTILNLIGAKLRPNNHVDGVSLLPLLKGDTIAERPLFWHYPHYGNQGGDPSSIVRLGDWKLIHYWENNKNELYNLSQDISEENNLEATQVGKVNELKALLYGFLDETNAQIPSQDPMWNEQKEAVYQQKQRDKTWPEVEKRRKSYLSKDFDPENSWWGSQTID